MNIEEIKETPIWTLYEKGKNYLRMTNVYSDTDRNHRMYNGNQWDGAKLGGVEPVQINFIKPIVKYKLSVIHDNLYAIKFSSMNFANRELMKTSDRYCTMLNRYANRVWEKDSMDKKLREITKNAAINDEGVLYIDFDRENMMPINEVIEKSEIYYGNENSEDIQSQPYILMEKRMPVSNAIEFALEKGLGKSKTDYIIGDNETFEQAGDSAKQEVDNMVTLVYKLYKKGGTIHYSIATRWLNIVEDVDMGISLYPVAHLTWEQKKGSARGEGEVRNLIPNQLEVNKTEMRRLLTVKSQAYPKTIADVSKIANPQSLDTVGGVIKTTGQTVDDVHKVVGVLPPAQMSPDVKQTLDDLIQTSRDLAGAGDTATGEIDPEAASGRAILAVQQAQRAPVTEQKDATKFFIEDYSRIWLEYLIAYSVDGVDLEEEITNEDGTKSIQIVRVPQTVLKQLQAEVRVDITPKSAYDKAAQEQTLENLLINGLFQPNRSGELRAYAEALDDDSYAPKQKILEIVERIEENQLKIARIEAASQLMQQRANQFLMDDPDGQAQQIADAKSQLDAEAQIEAQEEEYAEEEAELDEQTAEAEEDLPEDEEE